MDQITNTIKAYHNSPQKGISTGSSIKHIAQRISIQDGNKKEMINDYLQDIKKNLLQNISEFDKSDTSMRSGQSDTADAQSVDQDIELTESHVQKVEDFLASVKEQDNTIMKTLKGKDKI